MRFVWTQNNIKEEALKYKGRGEFAKKCGGAYNAAIKFGILAEVTSHMAECIVKSGKGHYKFKWTEEKLKEEALKYKTKKEFFEKSRGAYSTASNKKILKKICKHMEETVNKPWTTKELKEEASKYKTRNEFQKFSNTAWQIAHNRNLIDSLCSHMPKRVILSESDHPNFKWTFEKIQAEALKYKNKTDFTQNSPGAYKAALRKNIIDKVCSHMLVSGPISTSELNLFNIIKNFYPKTETLRIRSKRSSSLIKSKPHIKGFDLDIYVPELRKGIEFDGDYWHSPVGLKRSRLDWPEEDILDYHSIKDKYFNSKNIEIIHVKEEEWIKDKKVCIDKCLKFLNLK